MKARILTLFFLASVFPAGAQTGLLVPASTGNPDPKILSLREMSVDAGIARGFVRINVRQVYENHTAAVQEGIWRFQLPPSGLVGDFAVWDGLTRIPGVILEKRRARAIYRELTVQRIDPGLLQQGEEEDREPGASGRPADRPSGGAAFSVRVAPIPALGTKRLEMQYQYEVPWVDGIGEFRFPLKPRDGEGQVAGSLEIRVVLLDGEFTSMPKGSLDLKRKGQEFTFSQKNVKLDRDAIVRFKPKSPAPLTLTAFRNPAGSLPDGLALAPWERPSDVPPEKDGFFLLEYFPPAARKKPQMAEEKKPQRPPVSVVFLFDTSLSHRFSGLEAGYRELVSLLDELSPSDRFAVVPFDLEPYASPLTSATSDAVKAALSTLRSRTLNPGTNYEKAIKSAAGLLAGTPAGRIVLITDGASPAGGMGKAAGNIPVFSVLTGEERREGIVLASLHVLHLEAASEANETLFIRELFASRAAGNPSNAKTVKEGQPVAATGGDPKLRDVYPVLVQPPASGSLSGWVGRYTAPAANVTVSLKDFPDQKTTASFPETALEARDLPRRWARARVDFLLALIETEGEKREWVEEIIELSRRYKFVTPYTAFLAAPRSLLRPRRIQPGDPVIRVEADPGIISATALLPFGKSVTLVRRPKSNLWEGRFLVPDGLADGPMNVRLILSDVSGKSIVENKTVVIDGTPPAIKPELPEPLTPGRASLVAARADSDAIFLSARLGDGPPVPLRWNPATKRSEGLIRVPSGTRGPSSVFFEAADAAGNHGFARTGVEVY